MALPYSGPVGAIEVSTGIDTWLEANRLSAEINKIGGFREHMAARNNYMTAREREVRGFLCELAFAAWIGADPEIIPGLTGRGAPDILGYYDIKWMGWRRPAHMDGCEGGNLYVPPHCRAKVIVGMTCFDDTMMERCFVNGWIYGTEARRFPQGGRIRGVSGRYAHLVPFTELHDPATLAAA